MILSPGVPDGGLEKLALSRLVLTDFRCYTRASVQPSEGLNVVAGENAQGKTTLLEAVHLLATGRLLRGGRESAAIRHGEEGFTIEGETVDGLSEVRVQLRRGLRKRVLLNGNPLARASDLIGRLPCVSFSSADLAVVAGEPSDRRDFLDWEMSQTSRAYLRHLSVYKRALEQRNALLRLAQDGWVEEETFEPWERQMAESGSALRQERAGWVGRLAERARAWLGQLRQSENLALRYEPVDESLDPDGLFNLLASSRREDTRRGATSLGPHRDNLAVDVNGHEARHFGSQGQQRSIVISLKMAVLEEAEKVFGSHPILLLDDVFSDLDVGRRLGLMEATLNRGGQVFLTCTEPGQAGAEALERARLFRVDSGQVKAD